MLKVTKNSVTLSLTFSAGVEQMILWLLISALIQRGAEDKKGREQCTVLQEAHIVGPLENV